MPPSLFNRTSQPPTYRILVPLGGNPSDDVALRLACDIAKKEKGRVQAVYVIEVRRTQALDAELPPELEQGEAILREAEALGSQLQAEIDTELLQAREVGPAVVDEACDRGVQLIVMGLPYKRKFGDFSLGRSAPYILKHAPCKVWILCEPPAAAE